MTKINLKLFSVTIWNVIDFFLNVLLEFVLNHNLSHVRFVTCFQNININQPRETSSKGRTERDSGRQTEKRQDESSEMCCYIKHKEGKPYYTQVWRYTSWQTCFDKISPISKKSHQECCDLYQVKYKFMFSSVVKHTLFKTCHCAVGSFFSHLCQVFHHQIRPKKDNIFKMTLGY